MDTYNPIKKCEVDGQGECNSYCKTHRMCRLGKNKTEEIENVLGSALMTRGIHQDSLGRKIEPIGLYRLKYDGKMWIITSMSTVVIKQDDVSKN